MGLGTLPTRSDGQRINLTWFNVLTTALIQDLLPRDGSGVVSNGAGSIGSSSFKWLSGYITTLYSTIANITTGYWAVGDIKIHHSYNGAASPGEGWMLCDGRQITQANYDTEHGAGRWASYIGSSPLANKYLPDLTNRYAVGKATTTQDGSVAITSVGIAGHSINLAHSHTVNAHTHDLGNHTHAYGSGSSSGFAASGTGVAPTTAGPSTNTSGSASPGTDSKLNSPQSIQPDSIEVQYYMRII